MGIQERKEREKQQRRNDIIDAAEKVFFESGIENATMDDVAKEAELSKGTLYLYFHNKEDLHFAICIRGLEILKLSIEKIVSTEKTAMQNLVEIGKSYVRFSKEYPNYFKAMLYFEGTDMNDCKCEHKHTVKDDVLGFLMQLLESGKIDNSIRSDIPPAVLTQLLWSQITGVLQLMSYKNVHFEEFNISEEDIIQGHFEIIANGLRPGNNDPVEIGKLF